MAEVLGLLEKLQGVGLGTLLGIALFASYKGRVRWEREFLEMQARWEKRLDEERQDKNEWKQAAVDGKFMAKLAVQAVAAVSSRDAT